MKKLFLALLLAFLLCSCGVPEQIPDEPAPENDISSSDEEKELIGGETEDSDDYIINLVYETAEEELTRYTNKASADISHKVSNLVVNDNGTLTFDLTLKKGGKEITENMQGFWVAYVPSYAPSEIETSVQWGGYSSTGNGYLAICGINDVIIIDPEDLSVVDIEFELDGLVDNDLWINGVIYDENSSNWVISAAESYPGFLFDSEMRGYIFVFDEEGKLIRKYEPKPSAIYGGWLDFATPFVADKCAVIRKDGKTYYSFGPRSYCVEDGKTYQGSSISSPYDAKADGYSVYFYHCYNMDNASSGNYPSSGENLGYYAVLKDSDENILAFFPTDENYIHASWDDNTGEQTLELTHHGDLRFTLENTYLATSMELDFVKETYTLEYNYTDANLYELIATSSDGNYSLWQAGVEGGGEAYFYEVALKDNRTGKITHIAPNGTNAGIFSSEGFLRNGDFYVFCSRGLKIYDPKTAEMVFDIDENFPLENRILYTFRRDPNDFSYIVVYSDYDPENTIYDEDEYPYTASYTIKIGYLDKEGNLIKSFDSGVYERGDHFGLEYIEMRYSADELVLFTGGGKGYYGRQFTFDRKTETFSEPVPVE